MSDLVLFLCTGNYYRSRYAEELFNHLARAEGLSWRAISRGAAFALFVDDGAEARALLRQNVEALGVAGRGLDGGRRVTALGGRDIAQPGPRSAPRTRRRAAAAS